MLLCASGPYGLLFRYGFLYDGFLHFACGRAGNPNAYETVQDSTVFEVKAHRFQIAFDQTGLANMNMTSGVNGPLNPPLDCQIANHDGRDDMALFLYDDVATGGEVANGVVGLDLKVFEDQSLAAVRTEHRHSPACDRGGLAAVCAEDLLVRLLSNSEL